MSVQVIDTLKPKNGLDFPVVEAIDVAVEGYLNLADAVTHFVSDSAIATITAELATKASISDLAITNAAVESKADKTTTDSLQSQIDQIAQATGTGSADTEVAQARVDSQGISHETLNARINSDISALDYKIGVDISWIEGKYVNVNGALISNADWKATDYIPINDVVKYPIRYDVYAFENTYIGLYDVDKNFVRSIKITDSATVVNVSGVIDNFYGAKYIVFSSRLNRAAKVAFDFANAGLMQNSVASSTLVDNSVTEKKLAVLNHDAGTNYINYAAVATGRYISDDNGKLRNSADTNATDYIPLEPETQYYCKNLFYRYYAFYDEDKQFIASYSTLGNLGTSFTTPAGTKFGRFTIQNGFYTAKTAWINDVNETPPEFKYSFNIPISPDIDNRSIDTDKIKAGAVTTNEVDFIYHDPNSNYISGWVDNAYIRLGVETPYQGFYATEPVYLEENVQYYRSSLYAGYYAFYAEDGTVLEYHNMNENIPNPFTIPTNCKYARFTAIDAASKRNAWISTTNASPDPYRIILSPDIEVVSVDPLDVTNPCDYLGDDIIAFSKCLCIGDSLTAGVFNRRDGGGTQYITFPKYSYPAHFQKLTNIEATNIGISSATSGEWYNAEKNEDLSGYDIAIIQLGVNDNIRMGTLEMTLEEWFADSTKCGFANIITKLKNENTNIKIFVANIIPARSYHSESYIAFSDYLLNWIETTYADDPNVIALDIQQFGHTYDKDAYNCGHLSAYGYYRLAKDYKSYISWYMSKHPSIFKEIQFIGTDYWYDNPNT